MLHFSTVYSTWQAMSFPCHFSSMSRSWLSRSGQILVFLPRCMEWRRGLAMRKLSVCLSVCPSICLSVCLGCPLRAFQWAQDEHRTSLSPQRLSLYLKFWVNRPPLERNRRFSTIGRGACRKVGGQTSAVMASAGARAYNGGLGAEPPAGSRGRAPGQGVRGAKPPWSWKASCVCTSYKNGKFVVFVNL